MKRRFLSVLLTVAMLSTMFAGLAAGADAEDVVYFVDTDMDTDTSWNPSGCTYITDTMLKSRVAKYERAVGTGDLTARRNIDTKTYPNLAAADVLWGEISIKYEGAFTRFALEHEQASPPVWIDDDGSVRTGGYNVHKRPAGETGTDTGYDLELGKWYHIVSALDYTKNPTTGAITIWINGEKIVNAATPYSRLQGSKGLAYVDIKLVAAADTPSTVYIDNYRSYRTAAIDSHPENSAVSDENSADEIGLAAGYITGAENATVAAVQWALTNGDKLVFVKDGSVLASYANVLGATAYAPFANGKGFRTYKIATENTQLITKKYVDISFDNWTNSTHGIDVNNVKVIADDMWRGEKTSHSVATVPEKEGKVLKFPIATSTSTNDGYYVRARVLSGSLPSTYDGCDVLWTEYSIKYEGGFVGFGFGEEDNAFNLAFINKSGNMEVGTRWGYGEVTNLNPAEGFNRGTAVPNSQLEVGKWYHIVVAADFTDEAASSGVPTYIWINGELVGNGIKNTNITPGQKWIYHKLYFDVAESEGRTAYIDNLKVYETSTLDNHAAADFAIAVEDADSEDEIYFEDDFIIAPKTSTVAKVKDAITADNYTFIKDGAILSDEYLANGSTMYVNAANGIGIKQYEVVWGIPVDILGAHAMGISASIPTANTAHPVTGMINDAMSEDADIYKSDYYGSEKPLVVTIPLDAYYAISSVKIYERNRGGQRNVSVELGKDGTFDEVVTNVNLNAPTSGYMGVTAIDFAETEADTIRLTFTGTPANDQQTYQIWEIEAYAVKSGDFVVEEPITGPVGESAVVSIATSIPARFAANPVSGMINGNREYSSNYGGTDASLYKSLHPVEEEPLSVLITLDGVYSVDSFKLFERRYKQDPVTVSIFLGNGGVFTEVASDVAMTQSPDNSKAAQTDIDIEARDADAVMFVFENEGSYGDDEEEVESAYQISEIEVYGEKKGEVSAKAILPAYCFGVISNNAFVVAASNPGDVAIDGVMFVAAYEDDELVAVSDVRKWSLAKGVNAQYTMSLEGIIAEGRTYKAFLWNNMNDATPIFASKVITK